MRKGFLIYEEMRKYLTICEEAVSHLLVCMTLQPIPSEKFDFLHYQCVYCTLFKLHKNNNYVTFFFCRLAEGAPRTEGAPNFRRVREKMFFFLLLISGSGGKEREEVGGETGRYFCLFWLGTAVSYLW
jgi:hypothetical protein